MIGLSHILEMITYPKAKMPLNKRNASHACFPSNFGLLLLTWLSNVLDGSHCQTGQERGSQECLRISGVLWLILPLPCCPACLNREGVRKLLSNNTSVTKFPGKEMPCISYHLSFLLGSLHLFFLAKRQGHLQSWPAQILGRNLPLLHGCLLAALWMPPSHSWND